MLKRMPTRQIPGEPRRQWLTDDYFDLYVWHHSNGSIFGFQLCYGKQAGERALTWTAAGTFRHQYVDSGEHTLLGTGTPIVVHDCHFSVEPLRTEFIARSVQLEPATRDIILAKIDAFAAGQRV